MWDRTSPKASHHGAAFIRVEASHAKNTPKIENARDRSLWRLNLDHSQYSRCCVLQLPQWRLSSFRWRWFLWLRRHIASDLRQLPALRLDRWPTSRLGSVSCPSARSAANFRLASAVPLFRSTGGDSFNLRRTVFPPARPTTYLRFASVPFFSSAGGFIWLAPYAAPALEWLRFQFAPAASPFAFTGREPLSLRLVAPSPAEPLMHSLFPPNLASPAKPSMSIPFPLALASSGIFQLNIFRLASAFALLVRPAIPLWLAPQVSPSVRAGGHPPVLTGCPLRQPCWRSTSGLRRLSLLPAFRQPTPMPFRVIS